MIVLLDYILRCIMLRSSNLQRLVSLMRQLPKQHTHANRLRSPTHRQQHHILANADGLGNQATRTPINEQHDDIMRGQGMLRIRRGTSHQFRTWSVQLYFGCFAARRQF